MAAPPSSFHVFALQGVFIKTAESVALPLFQTLPDAPARIAGAAAAKEEAGEGAAKAAKGSGSAKAAGKPKAKKAAGSGKRAAAVAS